MFKLSKTTDYGIVLLAMLARDSSAEPQNARDLAAHSELPVPMVSKVLKALAKEGLLDSHRGSKGGYRLAREPEELTVAEMIRVLEGPVGLTDCAIGPALCEHETMCAVRQPWQLISRVVEQALENITLADLVFGGPSPAFGSLREMLQIGGRDSLDSNIGAVGAVGTIAPPGTTDTADTADTIKTTNTVHTNDNKSGTNSDTGSENEPG